MAICFTQPYATWQRGTNENTNGLLRQHFANGTDFDKVPSRQQAHRVKPHQIETKAALSKSPLFLKSMQRYSFVVLH